MIDQLTQSEINAMIMPYLDFCASLNIGSESFCIRSLKAKIDTCPVISVIMITIIVQVQITYAHVHRIMEPLYCGHLNS